jgi:hypothetical protein
MNDDLDKQTRQTVEVRQPDEKEINLGVTLSWKYEINPMDKDVAHYHGEDDGWVPTGIELDE